jgi:hypothetical protein
VKVLRGDGRFGLNDAAGARDARDALLLAGQGREAREDVVPQTISFQP